ILMAFHTVKRFFFGLSALNGFHAEPAIDAPKRSSQQMATRRTSRATPVKPIAKARAKAAPVKAPAAAPRSSLFVNSVEKAMIVLKAFDASKPRLTLSQIATLSDMDLSGAQRFTYTLVNLGYLRKDEATKTYALSPQVFE